MLAANGLRLQNKSILNKLPVTVLFQFPVLFIECLAILLGERRVNICILRGPVSLLFHIFPDTGNIFFLYSSDKNLHCVPLLI